VGGPEDPVSEMWCSKFGRENFESWQNGQRCDSRNVEVVARAHRIKG
jgi:hypothetical protein